MIIKLRYKGPKSQLEGEFEYDALLQFLKEGGAITSAEGEELSAKDKKALKALSKVKWQWINEDLSKQQISTEDVLAPLLENAEEIKVEDVHGRNELSLYQHDTVGASRGRRGLGRRRRRVGARWPGDPGRPRYRMGGGLMWGDRNPNQWFPAFSGGMPYGGEAYPQSLPEVSGLRRRRRRDVGARWPGDPGRARYRHGGGIMYGDNNPNQWFPAFSGGMPYGGEAYPQSLPVVSGRRRRRRDVGARWPGSPGRARYRHGGGVMYGDNNPNQSFPAMRGGIDYDYAYPQSFPISGPRRRRPRRDVGARWPGDPGRARYRHGGGIMYGYSNPYQSFPAMSGGMPYGGEAYPQSLAVSGPQYDW